MTLFRSCDFNTACHLRASQANVLLLVRCNTNDKAFAQCSNLMHLGIRPGHLSTRGQLLGYASAWFTMDVAPKLTGRVAAVCGAQGRVNIFACGREKKKKKESRNWNIRFYGIRSLSGLGHIMQRSNINSRRCRHVMGLRRPCYFKPGAK